MQNTIDFYLENVTPLAPPRQSIPSEVGESLSTVEIRSSKFTNSSFASNSSISESPRSPRLQEKSAKRNLDTSCKTNRASYNKEKYPLPESSKLTQLHKFLIVVINVERSKLT